MKTIKGAMFYSLIAGWCVYSMPNHSIRQEELRMGIKLLPAKIIVTDKVYKKMCGKNKQPSKSLFTVKIQKRKQ